MRSKIVSMIATGLLLSASMVAQQEHPKMSAEEKKMMEAYQRAGTPGEAHRALEPMVGTWDTVVKFWPAAGAPPQESRGVSETRWILGNRYLEQRFTGTAMGQPFEGIGYTGYDNIKKRYFGTWMDSMSTGIMSTTGSADKDGKTWTFKGTMDDPVTGKSLPIREKVVVHSRDQHVFEMWSPGRDGKVYKSMEIVYTRKK